MSHDVPAEVRRIFDACPFIDKLGLTLETVGQGESTTSLVLEPWHLQQDGYVHAGVQATMADHTAGAAAASLLADGFFVLTAEFKINLLTAARGRRLTCHARVIKPGRRLIVVESEVFCEAGDGESKLVSKSMGTIAVVPK